MKLSELKFKVVTGTAERNRAIQEAVFAKGGRWCVDSPGFLVLDAYSLAHNANAYGNNYPHLTHSSSLSHFAAELDAPEVTFPQALDLIAQVEVPEPKFPFKLKDECMVRDRGSQSGWKLSIFSHASALVFHTVGNGYCHVAKLNEKFLGKHDDPPEYWGLENGKPVCFRSAK